MTPIPAGWTLVPIEPTEEMLVALGGMGWMVQQKPENYAAMLAAAPSPASVAPGDAQDERQAFEAWFARRGVWPALCFEEVFIAGWNARPADAPAAGDALDAARYRWLRDPQTDVALVLDKRTGYVPVDERFPNVGGYHTYEYRAGEELDAAIDAALAAQVPQQGEA
ncbi:hypothetical protein [Achromobacter insolitus]|uniref:hypothetical protein n=1 Tax=Achromobacter insolitus TaxID=217204 RepID=UPI0007C22AD9|nr:hypothetical protein [Achromobacter insolitus]OAD17158.1 hypothetical protein A3839_24470 [Achromobacter insolitus]